MRTAFKRTLTVIIIAALSVCCGILYDRLCDRNERAEYPREYTSSVMKYSAEFGVPANIIYAALKVESNFNSALKTGEGENSRVGLIQLSADDYRTYGSRLGINTDPGLLYEPETNLTIGSYRISEYYEKYSDWRCVFSAMHSGTDTVDSWLATPELTDSQGKLKTIPDKETADYVERMEKTYAKYNELYG